MKDPGDLQFRKPSRWCAVVVAWKPHDQGLDMLEHIVRPFFLAQLVVDFFHHGGEEIKGLY
jgi:hypothetical protein